MTSERIVIACYKPFPGKEKELASLMKDHVNILREQGLVSDRTPILMRARDGTILEVFGWKSREAIENAHVNPAVQKMWEEYSRVCTYIPLDHLSESHEMFSEFSPLS